MSLLLLFIVIIEWGLFIGFVQAACVAVIAVFVVVIVFGKVVLAAWFVKIISIIISVLVGVGFGARLDVRIG